VIKWSKSQQETDAEWEAFRKLLAGIILTCKAAETTTKDEEKNLRSIERKITDLIINTQDIVCSEIEKRRNTTAQDRGEQKSEIERQNEANQKAKRNWKRLSNIVHAELWDKKLRQIMLANKIRQAVVTHKQRTLQQTPRLEQHQHNPTTLSMNKGPDIKHNISPWQKIARLDKFEKLAEQSPNENVQTKQILQHLREHQQHQNPNTDASVISTPTKTRSNKRGKQPAQLQPTSQKPKPNPHAEKLTNSTANTNASTSTEHHTQLPQNTSTIQPAQMRIATGFITISKHDKHTFIDEIYVRIAHRNNTQRKSGKTLIIAAQQHYQNTESLDLLVDNNNKVAIKIYNKYGMNEAKDKRTGIREIRKNMNYDKEQYLTAKTPLNSYRFFWLKNRVGLAQHSELRREQIA